MCVQHCVCVRVMLHFVLLSFRRSSRVQTARPQSSRLAQTWYATFTFVRALAIGVLASSLSGFVASQCPLVFVMQLFMGVGGTIPVPFMIAAQRTRLEGKIQDYHRNYVRTSDSDYAIVSSGLLISSLSAGGPGSNSCTT